MDKKVIFDKDKKFYKSSYLEKPKVPIKNVEEIFSKNLLRSSLPLPNLGELDVIRHYLNLAELNFSVDTNFYPLGSCTMKYNPKINEDLASLEGFTNIHPYQKLQDIEGSLELIYNLEQLLSEITGMKRFTFQPSSGAHGELAGMLMIRKFHEIKGNKKTKVIIPDSAHG
ncbi:MAG: aminomethyl-transferring glycine dehydrogenase subunit GcvPB, partial [Candidatus Omnitrophica bacterium]|nr:aminomethyl-transferring glycine dehydrogenase subunit GcvPB [Candidatus Omnitrophota bacterium]